MSVNVKGTHNTHTHTHTHTHNYSHTHIWAAYLYALKQTHGKGHMDSNRTNIWGKSCMIKQTYKHRNDKTQAHMWVHAHKHTHIFTHS